MTTTADQLILDAIAELQATMPDDETISISPDTPLLGGDVIDSLAFINLMASLESALSDIKGEPISLITEEVLTDDSHPFKDIGSLTQYIQTILNG